MPDVQARCRRLSPECLCSTCARDVLDAEHPHRCCYTGHRCMTKGKAKVGRCAVTHCPDYEPIKRAAPDIGVSDAVRRKDHKLITVMIPDERPIVKGDRRRET